MLDHSPIYHGWKVMLHQLQAVERTGSNWDEMVDKARFHMDRAVASTQRSSTISALLGQCHIMLGNDVQLGGLYANEALQLNPNNAFAYSALSCAELRSGNYQRALDSARHGIKLAGATLYAPWWHLYAGLAAMGMESYEDAIYHYRKAAMHAPNFRAPLRNLYVLYHATGQEEQAQRYLSRLLVEEPDFSVYRLKNDADYPASTIRASPLIAMI